MPSQVRAVASATGIRLKYGVAKHARAPMQISHARVERDRKGTM